MSTTETVRVDPPVLDSPLPPQAVTVRQRTDTEQTPANRDRDRSMVPPPQETKPPQIVRPRSRSTPPRLPQPSSGCQRFRPAGSAAARDGAGIASSPAPRPSAAWPGQSPRIELD